MLANYPRYVDNPKNPAKPFRVENADQHKRINPQDYQKFQDELAGDSTQGRGIFMASVSAEQERERCAIVAETFPRAGKTGSLIAAAIRGMTSDLFPKVLRNPESSPVKGGEFTEPGPKPDSFIRHDALVHDAVEEAEARALGYTVLVSDANTAEVPAGPATVPAKDPKDAGKEYPKLLRDPKTEEKPDAAHSEIRDGRYARPDVPVANLAQENNAKANGYTVEVKP